MILINYIYYFCLLLIFHTKHIWTYQCHKCATKVFNDSVTIDNLSSPTEDDCNIVTTVHGCYVHIDWLADGTTEVYYTTDPALPYDSILTTIDRQISLDNGKYSTSRSIGYSCRSNRTACNTIDDLKRAIISIKFPTDEQIEQFDSLITPTKNFNGGLCSRISNTRNCPKTNLMNCRQCMGVVQYHNHTDVCLTCPRGKISKNFFTYHTTIFLNMESQSERVIIGCQKRNACNSMKNIEQIKQKLAITLDSKKFYRSTALTTKSTVIFLFMVIFIGFFRLIEQHYS